MFQVAISGTPEQAKKALADHGITPVQFTRAGPIWRFQLALLDSSYQKQLDRWMAEVVPEGANPGGLVYYVEKDREHIFTDTRKSS